MSYNLEAFICKDADAESFSKHFMNAKIIRLDQGLILIPLTNELFMEMNAGIGSSRLVEFDCLTENIETEILKIIGDMKFAYVEAEYFGGRGGQVAIIWENQERASLFPPGKTSINEVLRSFGVMALPGMDEFDTLDFDRYRKTAQWR